MAMIVLDPFDPLPLHWAITVLAVLITVLSLVWLVRSVVRNRRLVPQRLTVSALGLLAAACFALAAWNPVRLERHKAGELHVAIVLDVSDSVLRVPGGWPQIRAATRDLVVDGLADVTEATMKQSSASIVTFRGGVSDLDCPLESLLLKLDHLDPDTDFASGDGSHVGAGLERAGEHVVEAGGRGEILLVSDGHDTEGEATQVAQQLARQSIPIHVLPVASRVPELAITSANLWGQVEAQNPTLLRGVVYNTGPEPVYAELQILQNPGVAEDATRLVGPAAGATVRYDPLETKKFHALRQEIEFQGLGIQFVDLILSETSSDAPPHRRRFFTHVNRPLNLLVVGGDLSWAQKTLPDFATVVYTSPQKLSTDLDLSQYDGLIVSAARAVDFDQGVLDTIATAVEKDGLGLFLVNGDHSGASEETRTILGTYHETPIAPLLPVSTVPRPVTEGPPARHVVIVIDASGSMGGWQLAKGVDIAQYIVTAHMRPQDRLDLIAFDTAAYHLVDNEAMDTAGKQRATRQLHSLTAGGDTDPKAALELIQDRQMKNCGLVFISDGLFSRNLATYRPDCRPTVFMVGPSSVPVDSPLHALADPFGVDLTFDPRSIQIPYFEPEQRKKFFERGVFKPLPMTQLLGNLVPTIPELELHGAAITYPKDEAELLAVRPKFVDPVLAYRRSGEGQVGVFTAGFGQAWTDTPQGRGAIREWVERTVPYFARDRYAFRVTDDGNELSLRLEIHNREGDIPEVENLAARIETDTGSTRFGMTTVPGSPATFAGAREVPRTETTQLATLVIEEWGPDALPRPQRIPILIPPESPVDAGTTTEAASFGLDENLLKEITEVSGGLYDPGDELIFSRQPPDVKELHRFWPCLVALGALFYWLAIAARRLNLFGR